MLPSGWWALAGFSALLSQDSAQAPGHAAGETRRHCPTALMFSQTKLCLPSASQSCLLHVCRAQNPGLGKANGPRKHSSNRVSNFRLPSYSQCWIRVFPYFCGLYSSSLCTSLDFRQTKSRKGFASYQAGIIARWPHLLAGHTSGKWQTGRLKWDTILAESQGVPMLASRASASRAGLQEADTYTYVCTGLFWSAGRRCIDHHCTAPKEGAGPVWTISAFKKTALVARLLTIWCIHISRCRKWLNYSKQASDSMIKI